jgi:hypothetical protein
MKCLICKSDINELVKQYGDVKTPICQSCYLDGGSWIYDEPTIVNELLHGADLEDAQKICIKEEMSELEKFARDFLTLPFTDSSPVSEDEEAARMEAGG